MKAEFVKDHLIKITPESQSDAYAIENIMNKHGDLGKCFVLNWGWPQPKVEE